MYLSREFIKRVGNYSKISRKFNKIETNRNEFHVYKDQPMSGETFKTSKKILLLERARVKFGES